MKKILALLLVFAASVAVAAEVGHRIPRYWSTQAYTDNLTVYGKGVVARDSITLNGEAITSWDNVATVVSDYEDLTNRPTLGGATLSGALLDDPANYPTLNQNTTGSAASVPWTGVTGRPNATDNVAITGGSISGVSLSSDNIIGSGGSIDNTPIGSTTPSSGAFTSLERGVVSDDEFLNLDNSTSPLQAQIDLKAPLASPTFTGTVTIPELAVGQVSSTCDPALNECKLNASNAGLPTTGMVAGDWMIDNSANLPTWRSPDNSTWLSSPIILTKDFVVKGATAADNTLLFKAEANITVTQLDCIIDPAEEDGTDNVTVTLLECSSSGDSCASGGISVVATNAGALDSSFTDAAIDVGDWVQVTFGDVQGTASFLSCTLRYRLTR